MNKRTCLLRKKAVKACQYNDVQEIVVKANNIGRIKLWKKYFEDTSQDGSEWSFLVAYFL